MFRIRYATFRLPLLLSVLLTVVTAPAFAGWTKIVFVSDRDHHGKFDLYLMNPDGSGVRKILSLAGSIRHPRFSPDGRKIAFQNDGPRSLCTINPDGTDLRTIAYDTYDDYAMPEWSRDGKRLACARGGGSTWNLYTLKPDGSDLTQVTDGHYEDTNPTWSPDGRKIAFITNRWHDAYSTYSSIYLMDANGDNLQRITPDTGAWFSWLQWSPVGNKLLSTAPTPATDDYNTALVSLDTDGRNLQFLTADTPSPSPQSRLTACCPSWSPDANKILYVSDRNGTANDIYVTGPSGGNGSNITNTPLENLDPHLGKAACAISPVGTGDYQSACVSPANAVPGTQFVFKIRYRHVGGMACQYLKLYVFGPGGKAIAGSPFTMTPGTGGNNWPFGIVYTRKLKLSLHGRHSYYLTASDGRHPVRWPETGKASGPLVDRPPVLSWAGGTGYTADGLEPNSGAPGTQFTFKLKYKDPDGDPCTGLSVLLLSPGGSLLPNVPLTGAGATWKAGVIYTGSTTLTAAGTYCYSFSVNNRFRGVNWPTSWPEGPVVGATAPALVLSTLATTQTNQGVTLTLRCSAAAAVQGEIVNLAGRVIAVLPAATLQPGVATLLWNGRSGQGTRPPPGQYLVRLTARAASGESARTLTPLRLR